MLPGLKEGKGVSGLRSLFKEGVGFGGSEPVRRPTFVGRPVPLRPVALSPTGRSFRCWKFLGLRPRTTMAADLASAMVTLSPDDKVATSLRRATKCCWSSFRRPLLAVAILNCSRFHAKGHVTNSTPGS